MIPQQNCSQDFLNDGQYQRNGILRYERVFGKTYVSTGGETTTKDIVALANLKPGMRVLDIGCGTGGSAFFMAKHYGAEVLGIDLSDNMLAIANEHKREMSKEVQNLVTFRFLDATLAHFPAESFDVVYSRDAIMHIADKEPLYEKVLHWLKPGGQVLVSEYINQRETPQLSKKYIEYLKLRGYQLITVRDYGNILKRVGFSNVKAMDKTDEFVRILKMEMERFEPSKGKFIKEFSQKDYDELVDGWKIKVVRCSDKDQGWGWFHAYKQ